MHLKSSCDPARNSHGHKFPRLFTVQDEEKLMGWIEQRFKSNVKFLRKDCHFLSAVAQPNHFHLPQSSEFHCNSLTISKESATEKDMGNTYCKCNLWCEIACVFCYICRKLNNFYLDR